MAQKLSFEAWLNEVDKHLPCHHDDLPDVCYRDWYDDDVTPRQAARRAMRNAME